VTGGRGAGGQRGPQTEAQKAALARGRAKREATKKRANSPKPAKSRHQMLLDGELKVHDLDEQELKHFRGRDIDGEFKGRIRPIPAKLQAQIRQRLLNLMQANIEGFLPRAVAILESIAEESDQDSARVKAVDLLLQRGAGKVPDVVRVGAEDPWDVILGDALREGAFDSEEMNRLKDGLSDLASRGGDDDGF
jgi:hypothetical protein